MSLCDDAPVRLSSLTTLRNGVMVHQYVNEHYHYCAMT
jgi:hypothetical protein